MKNLPATKPAGGLNPSAVNMKKRGWDQSSAMVRSPENLPISTVGKRGVLGFLPDCPPWVLLGDSDSLTVRCLNHLKHCPLIAAGRKRSCLFSPCRTCCGRGFPLLYYSPKLLGCHEDLSSLQPLLFQSVSPFQNSGGCF